MRNKVLALFMVVLMCTGLFVAQSVPSAGVVVSSGVVLRTGLLADLIALWSGCNSTTPYLRFDGTCSGSSSTAPTQVGISALDIANVAINGTDVGPGLNTYINGLTGPQWIGFPCGNYRVIQPIVITTKKPLKLFAYGTSNHTGGNYNGGGGCVKFTSNQPINIMTFNYVNVTSAEDGPDIEGIEFADDSTNHDQVISGLRLVQVQNPLLVNLTFTGMTGTHTQSTCTVGTGTNTITGTGFSSAMNGGMLWIAGYPHEINVNPSAQGLGTSNTTTMYLTNNYPTGRPTGSQTCAIDYGGMGLVLDPGYGTPSPPNFSQYGTIMNIKSWQVRVSIDMMGGTTNNWGVSRFKFFGGFLNPRPSTQNSIGVFCGGYCDTANLKLSINNATTGIFFEEAHENRVEGSEIENSSSSFPLNTTCTTVGGQTAPGARACTVGVDIEGATGTHSQRNEVTGTEFNQMGNAIEIGEAPQQTDIHDNNFGTDTSDVHLPAVGKTGNDTTFMHEYPGLQLSEGTGSVVTFNGYKQGKLKDEVTTTAIVAGTACVTPQRIINSGTGKLFNCESNLWVAK